MKKLLAAFLCMAAFAWGGDKSYEKTNIPPGMIKVFDGVDKTGVTDITNALITFLQSGGYLFIPDGDYLINGAGASAGGAYAELTKSIHVECGPKAVLHGTNLDHTMVRLNVPATGVGLPTGGIFIIWHGCTFDQTTQKTSTSVPFSGTYTSTNQGTSAITDGLDINSGYTPVATELAGIYYAEISGATFKAGTHWQNAGSGSGGDSGVLCGGVTNCQVHDNVFYGCRDACIYASNAGTGTLDVRMDIYGNYFKGAFQCVAVKRATLGFSIHDNTCVNAVLGFASQSGGSITTTGSSEGAMYNNRCSGCQVNERVDAGTNISIHDEKCDNFGAFLADGTTVPNTYTAVGMQLQGMTYSNVHDNTCTSISATYAALNPAYISVDDLSSPLTVSTYNRIYNNISVGFHSIGGEAAGSGSDYNDLNSNYEFTGTVHDSSSVGTHSSVTRYNFTTGARTYMNPQIFDDGLVSAPIIARRSDTTTGLFFGTSLIDFSVGGTERARVSTSGLTTTALVIAPITTSAIAVNSTSATNQTLGAGAGVSTSLNGRFTADVNAAQHFFLKSRNTTIGSFTTINTGDCIGKDLYYADDGTTYNSQAGEIDVCSTGTIATGKVPGQYLLKLADSNGTLQTALTGTSAGMSTALAFTSTLATGTAPFTVASTTNVANLNASLLGGATFAAPTSIGSGAPAAGAFTTLTATTPVALTSGGTGASTAQGAAQAIKTRYVVCASGTTVSAPADTTEDALYTCTIPANSLGANGSIIFTGRFTFTNSANNKIVRVRYSTITGTAVYQQTLTTSTNQPILPITIQNKNATGTQESGVNSLTSYTASAGTVTAEAVDTTASSTLVYTCAKASSGETCSISSVLVEIVNAP